MKKISIVFLLVLLTVSVFAQMRPKNNDYSGSSRSKTTTDNYTLKENSYSSTETISATESEIREAKALGKKLGTEDGKAGNNRSRSRNPYNSSDPRYDAFMGSYRTAFIKIAGEISWNDTGWW